jgi:hypothetical protein
MIAHLLLVFASSRQDSHLARMLFANPRHLVNGSSSPPLFAYFLPSPPGQSRSSHAIINQSARSRRRAEPRPPLMAQTRWLGCGSANRSAKTGHKKTSTAASSTLCAEQRVEAISLAALCEPHRRIVFFSSLIVYETLVGNVKGKLASCLFQTPCDTHPHQS